MENNSSPTPQTLEERVATLEDYVTKISRTLYDLIARFKAMDVPPCPQCATLLLKWQNRPPKNERQKTARLVQEKSLIQREGLITLDCQGCQHLNTREPEALAVASLFPHPDLNLLALTANSRIIQGLLRSSAAPRHSSRRHARSPAVGRPETNRS